MWFPPVLPRPCLQDKILQSMSKSNEVTVTNDGATILKSVYVDNPAAKVLVGKAPWAKSASLACGSCVLRAAGDVAVAATLYRLRT